MLTGLRRAVVRWLLASGGEGVVLTEGGPVFTAEQAKALATLRKRVRALEVTESCHYEPDPAVWGWATTQSPRS
jgi:hypothetical protein